MQISAETGMRILVLALMTAVMITNASFVGVVGRGMRNELTGKDEVPDQLVCE